MSYATPAQMITQYDARSIGALVRDDGTRANPIDLLTDDNLQAALDRASGKLEASLLAGGRYAVSDLDGLTGNSAAYLVYLCCVLAFDILYERRPYDDTRAEIAKRADEAIEQLRKGAQIFNVPAVIEAGLPEVTGVTQVEYNNLNLVAGRARGHMYPQLRLPGNR